MLRGLRRLLGFSPRPGCAQSSGFSFPKRPGGFLGGRRKPEQVHVSAGLKYSPGSGGCSLKSCLVFGLAGFFHFFFFLENTKRLSFFTPPACSPVPCTAWEERCSNSPFPAAFLFLSVTLQNLCCFGQMPAQGAEELGSGSSTSLLCVGGTHGCWGSVLPGTPTAMLEGKARRDHNRGRRSGLRGFHLSSPDLLPQHLPPKTPSGP